MHCPSWARVTGQTPVPLPCLTCSFCTSAEFMPGINRNGEAASGESSTVKCKDTGRCTGLNPSTAETGFMDQSQRAPVYGMSCYQDLLTKERYKDLSELRNSNYRAHTRSNLSQKISMFSSICLVGKSKE